MGIKSLYVSTDVPSQVYGELRRQLSGGPTRLATDPKQGEAQVKILAESGEKVILTLTGAGRVFDYQLRLRVRYQVTDGSEKPVIAPSEIEVRRIISYSETAPLAKEAEEKLLFDDMRVEAAQQILRRIAVVRGYSPS